MQRKDIHTRSLANGTSFSIPVFHFPGSNPHAPSAYIQSGIHGSEVQGYAVLLHLIDFLLKHPPMGSVTIVPIANPHGLNCKMGEYTFGRFDSVTGENWNRNYLDCMHAIDAILKDSFDSFEKTALSFKNHLRNLLDDQLSREQSYSKKLAFQLQRMAVEADVVLDLHCDTFSVPHVYSPIYAVNSAEKLGIPFIIDIPPVFSGALDEAICCPWIHFTEQYNRMHGTDHVCPVESFTVELGHQEHIDFGRARQHMSGILNYCASKGIMPEQHLTSYAHTIHHCALHQFTTVYAPYGGLIVERAELGRVVSEKNPLVLLSVPDLWMRCDSDLVEQSTHRIVLDTPCIPISHSASPIVHEGMALMKVMTMSQHSG